MTPHRPGLPICFRLRALAFGLVVLLGAACTVSLLPQGDRALLQRIDELNRETLTLFAALETGASAGSFARFAPQYNQLIGGFEAAKAQAEARPVPRLGMGLSESAVVQEVCAGQQPEDCLNETPKAMARIAGDIRAMRDDHRAGGLAPGAVTLYRETYALAISGALAIETALIR